MDLSNPRSPSAALAPRARLAWRAAQSVVWLLGVAVVAALFAAPELGIDVLWNGLIPAAPLLLLIAPGLWRNVCPLASTSLFARHVGLSRARRLSPRAQGWFALASVALLAALVPLRHVALNRDGPATAIALLALGSVAVGAGLFFEWRSGWCSGLCPVHPVEQLYGQKPAATFVNAHCHACARCVEPCADSTRGMHPLRAARSGPRRLAGTLMTGGFAGFVWGWFQVPDFRDGEGWRHLDRIYAWPFAGAAATLVAFLLLRRLLGPRRERGLVLAFAGAAVACYYWFRLPALLGLLDTRDGVLVDARALLPAWSVAALRTATTGFVFGWLALRGPGRSWTLRPPSAALPA